MSEHAHKQQNGDSNKKSHGKSSPVIYPENGSMTEKLTEEDEEEGMWYTCILIHISEKYV